METLTEQNGKTDAFQRGDCLEKIQQNFKCTDKSGFQKGILDIIWVGTNQGYLLLQGFTHCTGITKPHEIIVNTFFCLSVSFHAVKCIRLEHI